MTAVIPSLIARLRAMVYGVKSAVATRVRQAPPMREPLGVLIPRETADRVVRWLDLQLQRIVGLMGRIEAGTQRAPRPYASRSTAPGTDAQGPDAPGPDTPGCDTRGPDTPGPDTPEPWAPGRVVEDAAPTPRPHPSPEQNLRRAFGWVGAMAQEAFLHRTELERLLDEPAMQAMVLDTPQMGRLLRPLMRAMAVKQPDWMPKPAKRKRRSRGGRRRWARVAVCDAPRAEPIPYTSPAPVRSGFEPPVVDDPVPYQLSALWRGVAFPPPRRRW